MSSCAAALRAPRTSAGGISFGDREMFPKWEHLPFNNQAPLMTRPILLTPKLRTFRQRPNSRRTMALGFRLIELKLQAIAKQSGLSWPLYQYLELVASTPFANTTFMAKHLRWSRSKVNRWQVELLKRGLLSPAEGSDRRQTLLQVTPAGRRLLRGFDQLINNSFELLFFTRLILRRTEPNAIL